MNRLLSIALIYVALALSACGGGSDGDTTAPVAPEGFTLTPNAVKTFGFSWIDVSNETEYRLLEDPDGHSGFTAVASIAANNTDYDLEVFLPGRINARYILQACNSKGCADSTTLSVTGSLTEAVGYVKASNTGDSDRFGWSVALATDGNTLAVGAWFEASNAKDVDGNQIDNSAPRSGAVYVFTKIAGIWSQQGYLKASNSGSPDLFGSSVALAADGSTLAVGAQFEASSASGIDGNQANNSADNSGAVYVYTRTDGIWSQQAYVKASNTGAYDEFGASIALSADGNTLAVGAAREGGLATGINGDQSTKCLCAFGAVYVYTRNDNIWSQQAYVKASDANTGGDDCFGASVALAADGNTLAVGSIGEASNATGIDGNETNDSVYFSGAVYVFNRSDDIWTQQAFVKASNTGEEDYFGWSVALAADGNILAVGAVGEASNAIGISGNQTDNSVLNSGAVYVYARTDGIWSQQAYVKSSNTGESDRFGTSVALGANGNILAVGASGENSNATGINGNHADNSLAASGAVYVFTQSSGTWSQQAYVKASNTGVVARFGGSVALAADGNILAVGAAYESGSATGIGGNQADNSADSSGAVYLY